MDFNNDNDEDCFEDDFEKELYGSSMMVDAEKILNRIKEDSKAEKNELPLCSHFLETRKKSETKSTFSWLSICDKDTLNMILEHIKSVRGDNVDTKEKADKIEKVDIFDNPKKFIEKDIELKNKENDLYGLITLLLSWEHDRLQVPAEAIEISYLTLAIYTASEIDKRNGLIEVTGSGTLLSQNTFIKASAKLKALTPNTQKLLKMGKQANEQKRN